MILFLLIFFIDPIFAQQAEIKIRNVCLCDLDLTSDIRLSCTRSSKLYITNAFIYDDTTPYIPNSNCTEGDDQTNPLFIRDTLSVKCNSLSECTFTEEFLLNVLGDHISVYSCAKVKIEWICITSTNTNNNIVPNNSSNNTSDDAYDFRYYLYVIIGVFLIISVIITTVLIVRRFIVRRRMLNRSRVRTQTSQNGQNRFYIIYQHNRDNINAVNEDAAAPPPLYNTVTTSLPHPPPPSTDQQAQPPPPLYETVTIPTANQPSVTIQQ